MRTGPSDNWACIYVRSAVTSGVGLAVLSATLSGFAVFIGAQGVREFPNPSAYTALRNTLVAFALLALIVRPGTFAQLRQLSSREKMGLALLGIVGGSVPFVLFFEGLSRVGSGSAAVIQKTMFMWVAALAVLFLRERLTRGQLGAIGLLLVAQMLLGWPIQLGFGPGEIMILVATLLWSVEVVLAKRLLATVNSSLAATARMSIGAAVLLGYLTAGGQVEELTRLSSSQWGWAIGPSLLLLAYVLSWYAALQRAPATTVTCLLTIGAPITALLSVLAGGGLPSTVQLAGFVILVGAALLVCILPWIAARPDRLEGARSSP